MQKNGIGTRMTVQDDIQAKRIKQQEKRIERRDILENEIKVLRAKKKKRIDKHRNAMNSLLGRIRQKENSVKKLNQQILFEATVDIDREELKKAIEAAKSATKAKQVEKQKYEAHESENASQ
ncbi:MAG: hypothetical protein HUN04_06230 [Desulfobacter sp.]|nr:MAG: hypothetical protein HUN04_06230 [Desulfobacter sp.]